MTAVLPEIAPVKVMLALVLGVVVVVDTVVHWLAGYLASTELIGIMGGPEIDA